MKGISGGKAMNLYQSQTLGEVITLGTQSREQNWFEVKEMLYFQKRRPELVPSWISEWCGPVMVLCLLLLLFLNRSFYFS
jgi:hypothetical protein